MVLMSMAFFIFNVDGHLFLKTSTWPNRPRFGATISLGNDLYSQLRFCLIGQIASSVLELPIASLSHGPWPRRGLPLAEFARDQRSKLFGSLPEPGSGGLFVESCPAQWLSLALATH